MRNLWIFISKYNAFFLFILFFGVSFFFLIQRNSFQRTSVINSSNRLIGSIYERVNDWKSYFHLHEENALLIQENAALRASLKSSSYSNSLDSGTVLDSLQEVRYTYLGARVINNSLNLKNNVFTINRGRKHGIKEGMGVIASKGVAGIILHVSEHFSTVQSFLNSDTRISASLESSKAFGALIWGPNNHDPKTALLTDIPNHIQVQKGEKVITSGYSLFPEGIVMGTVTETGLKSGDSFLNIGVALNIDFTKLRYVYVVIDNLAEEKIELEEQSLDNG